MQKTPSLAVSLLKVALVLVAAAFLPPAIDKLIGYAPDVSSVAYASHVAFRMLLGAVLFWVVVLNSKRTSWSIVGGVLFVGLIGGAADNALGLQQATGGLLHSLHLIPLIFLGAFLLIYLLAVWGALRKAPTEGGGGGSDGAAST